MSLNYQAQLGSVDKHIKQETQLTSDRKEIWGALHNQGQGQRSYTSQTYHSTHYPMSHEDARNLYHTSVACATTQHMNWHHYTPNALPYQMYPASNPFSSHVSGVDASKTHLKAFNSGFSHDFQFQAPAIPRYYPSPMMSPALSFVQVAPNFYNPNFHNPLCAYPQICYPNIGLHMPAEATKSALGNPAFDDQEAAYVTPPASPGDDIDSDTEHTISSPRHLTLELVSPLLKRNVEDADDVDETWMLLMSGTKDLWPPPSYVSWLSKRPVEWAEAYLNASDNPSPTPKEAAERDIYRYDVPESSSNKPYFVEKEPGMGYTFTNCQLVEVISREGTKKVIERILKKPMFFCWSCGKGVGAAKGTPKDIVRHLGVHGEPSWSCKAVGCECNEDLFFKRQERLYKHCRSVNPDWIYKKPYTRRKVRA